MLVHIRPGKPVIAVNAKRSAYRQRFSLAHEIGHFVLRHDSSVSFFEDSCSTRHSIAFRPDAKKEREVNIFASELLMPKVTLAHEAHKYTPRFGPLLNGVHAGHGDTPKRTGPRV